MNLELRYSLMLMAASCSFLAVLYLLVVVLSGSCALPKCCVSFDSMFYYRSHVFFTLRRAVLSFLRADAHLTTNAPLPSRSRRHAGQ